MLWSGVLRYLEQRKLSPYGLLTENNLRRLEAVRIWENRSAEVEIETCSPGTVSLQVNWKMNLEEWHEHQEVSYFTFVSTYVIHIGLQPRGSMWTGLKQEHPLAEIKKRSSSTNSQPFPAKQYPKLYSGFPACSVRGHRLYESIFMSLWNSISMSFILNTNPAVSVWTLSPF